MPYKDPEKNRECGRKWREDNPEKARTNSRKWREENPERAREYSLQYYEENLEKERANALNWYHKNRLKAVDALGGKCVKCGLPNCIPAFLDIDHINGLDHPDDRTPSGIRRDAAAACLRALVRGEDITVRFQLLCPNCHRIKTQEGTSK